MSALQVVDERGPRRYVSSDFPLALGGDGADVLLPGEPAGRVLAHLGLEAGELFVQPVEAGLLRCNGTPLAASRWLRSGDVLAGPRGRAQLAESSGELRLTLESGAFDQATEPPLVVATSEAATPSESVRAVAFKPASVPRTAAPEPPPPRSGSGVWSVARWLLLALLSVALWFVFGARAVEIEVRPEPERMRVEGRLLPLELGGRHLLRPGRYRLVAERSGYERLEQVFDVGHDTDLLSFELEPLGGRLRLDTGGVAVERLLVDGRVREDWDGGPLALRPGSHSLELVAERHLPWRGRVEIEGAGREQSLAVELQPAWARLRFESEPEGARLLVDGREQGSTPLELELDAGRRELEWRLTGHAPERRGVIVQPGVSQTLRASLVKAPGRLRLSSTPAGALVNVDGSFGGNTPLELELAPGRKHVLELSAPGHAALRREIQLAPYERRSLELELVELTGTVNIVAVPEGSELWIDGEPRGVTPQTLELAAREHQLELRKQGYQTHRQTLSPRPGYPLDVRVALAAEGGAEPAQTDTRVRTPQGQELVLIGGGRFQLGASRREPGRRANESFREVELTRPYYLSVTEVTNAQFREFDSSHSSGSAGGQTLDSDQQPVVRISWEQAARYCNWLSKQQGLPEFYREFGETLVPVTPPNTGYRLPTEPEWVWAARYQGGASASRRFVWGDELPVPSGSTNLADQSAEALIRATIPDYADGHPVTAPVASYPRDALGLADIGGNVAEWVHDYYTIYVSSSTGLQRDPLGPEDGKYHVIRGASWMHSTLTELRLSYRDYGNGARPDLGFRVARYAE